MTDPMTDYELGVWATEWFGHSTRGVDPAELEQLGALVRPQIDKIVPAVNEVAAAYRALPWPARLMVRTVGRVSLWWERIRP